MEIAGTAALVTGAGRGLGAATARMLAARGAKVAALDREAPDAPEGGLALTADVTDEAAVERTVAECVDAFGAPRIVVNCAGIAPAARMVGREGKTSVDLFRQVIGVNLIGTYAVMTYAARAMMEAGQGGVIVNTASAAYQDGQVGQSAYAASKGAVASMCLPLAREMARAGIRVCAIAPGLFRTPMMEALPKETVAGIEGTIPYPTRLGHPDEFALLACQIIENDYLNGEVIRLDGATRLPPK